jgi:glutaminyl-peptide cyclotransferase
LYFARVTFYGLWLLGVAAFAASNASTSEIWKRFSGANAFGFVQKLVELGPRPAASDALERSRDYIKAELKKSGWRVTSQTFTDKTPRGVITFVNLIATFGEQATPSFLLCSHYDTKTFDTVRFVGANDGGSSTGLLLELARVLATDPALARKTELVFFDGEEAFVNFTETDGLYGSRHFAEELRVSGKAKQFRGGILFDMIGDKSLVVTLPPNSPATLARNIFAAADALKLRDHFTYFQSDVTDDHTPLNAAGIPVIDLIDFDYPPWHTAEDTLDKISAESLEIVGRVALYDLVRLELK